MDYPLRASAARIVALRPGGLKPCAPWIVCLLAGVCLLCGCRSGAPQKEYAKLPQLFYQVLIDDTASQIVQVQVNIANLDDDIELDLGMRTDYMGAQLEAPLIEGDIRAVDSSGRPLDLVQHDPFHWSLNTDGADGIELSYRISTRHRSLPGLSASDLFRQPYLEADHALLVTAPLLIVPRGVQLSAIWVDFVLPLGWQISCPWDRLSDDTYSLKSAAELTDSIVAVGNWRVHDLDVDRMNVRAVFAPGQTDLEQEAIPLIEKIVQSELALFKRPSCSRYLFCFTKPLEYGFDASTKEGALLLAAGPFPDGSLPLDFLAIEIATAFFQTWDVSRYDCPDALRFIHDGFARYYAFLLQARERMIPWDEFAMALGACMAKCEALGREPRYSLVQAGGMPRLTDPKARCLLEQGGLLVAALLDAQIRRTRPDRSLDDFMRTLNNDPQWASKGEAPGLEEFLGITGAYAGEAFAGELERLVTQPFSIDAAKVFPAAGIPVEKSIQPIRPVLQGSLNGTTVTDLDLEGLAFKLGVRPGDRFKQVNGVAPVYPGDVYTAWSRPVSNRIELVLERAGEEIRIESPVPEVTTYTVGTDPWTFGR